MGTPWIYWIEIQLGWPAGHVWSLIVEQPVTPAFLRVFPLYPSCFCRDWPFRGSTDQNAILGPFNP